VFTTTSIYFFMLFIIVWCYCGYLVLLLVFSTLHPDQKKKEPVSGKLPKIAVVIPCFNEGPYVKQKMDNLQELNYDPKQLEIHFIDGCSTDNTKDEILRFIGDNPNWHLMESKSRGKIQQLNYGLTKIGEDVEYIVNTDMDAILSPDVLLQFANEFKSDDRIALVGANISPMTPIPMEEYYWQDQNILRIIESKVYTSSIVVAPCYAYRRTLLDKFPEDCIADDIYIAFRANTEGYFTKYVDTITGTETRSPCTSSDFFQHKFRKGNAYLVELFRFFHRLPHMCGWWKVIYLTKLMQLSVIPWILPYFLLSTISLALSGWGMFQMAFFGMIFLFSSFLVTSIAMKKERLKYFDAVKTKKRNSILPFIISNLILITVGLSFPFYKQTSCYDKIGKEEDSCVI